MLVIPVVSGYCTSIGKRIPTGACAELRPTRPRVRRRRQVRRRVQRRRRRRRWRRLEEEGEARKEAPAEPEQRKLRWQGQLAGQRGVDGRERRRRRPTILYTIRSVPFRLPIRHPAGWHSGRPRLSRTIPDRYSLKELLRHKTSYTYNLVSFYCYGTIL